MLARYNADGTLDANFGGSAGFATYDFDPTLYESAADLRIEPNGNLVVAGTAGNDMLVARMLPTTGAPSAW